MIKIKGVGKSTIKKYGDEIVAMTTSYCEEHGIDEDERPEIKPAVKMDKSKPKKTGRVDTKKVSFELFKTGLTLSQIAKERGLVKSTVQGHMAFFVEKGTVEIDKVLPPEKRKTIEKKLGEQKGDSLADIKQALGADYAYSEIKMVQAHQKYQARKNRGSLSENRDQGCLEQNE
ncbi:MAG: helix-turn-helix domain-containing protein [Nitrospinota bacterium]